MGQGKSIAIELSILCKQVNEAGYANIGDGEKTLDYFVRMLSAGMRPDWISFENILNCMVSFIKSKNY